MEEYLRLLRKQKTSPLVEVTSSDVQAPKESYLQMAVIGGKGVFGNWTLER